MYIRQTRIASQNRVVNVIFLLEFRFERPIIFKSRRQFDLLFLRENTYDLSVVFISEPLLGLENCDNPSWSFGD